MVVDVHSPLDAMPLELKTYRFAKKNLVRLLGIDCDFDNAIGTVGEEVVGVLNAT